ncbi:MULTISPECIES: NACHT domain-containing protein [Calothrix]|uniref:NACHT domain-containing NTPase n=2 Tax=Calothrix TaxID=1186 RepID=A0ABR8AAL8_9CYAN|nr:MULTISPECIES: NACHT domain-containing NTPase [Calothrix]MBD2197045.1 NACHT domain-containing NTPase [Calothrix parietina FACHB-288]MBD2225734.1 NACHT domain-containing NTPase [Calothrix anomala FACHB-343]
MVKRSLQASHQGIQSAKLALIDKFGTQQKLADALSVTRQPVNKFFNRKPVDSSLFVEICKKLGLEWQEIQENRQSEVKQTSEQDSDIDALVQEIREQVKSSIKEKCGTMRVLDMPQPIELTGERGIYTNVNILEKITGRRRLDISELLQNSEPDNFERFGLNRVKEKRIPGIEAVQRHYKLMVFGKPGAGKTTFLKYLAMQCIEGQYLTNRVPLFITLKDFAETPKQPDLLEYIAQKLTVCGVQDASVKANKLLRQGKLLVLLDGLDEVRAEDTKRVLLQIRDISDQFHSNQFVITCRIAANEYTFESFTEVEVADFDKEQITIFAEKWFRLTDLNEAKRFINKLAENKGIQELATSPLLLTLLCLVFAEKKDFPKKRSKLYQEGLRILLKKWDAKIFNERDHVYKNLSMQCKEDLLSQIALATFEQQNYFFKQETVEVYITEFFRKLYHPDLDTKILRLDSEAVLKSLEAQHGLLVERAKRIYSFSHLTFHEYFSARKIVANSAWEKIVDYLTEKRWQEVIFITTEMMRNADDLLLLIKQKVDSLLALDDNLQEFLVWVDEKTRSVNTPYKSVAVRAFYTSELIDYIHFLDGALSWELAGYYEPAIDPDYERGYDEWLQQQLQEIEAFRFGDDDSSYNPTQCTSQIDRTPFNWDLAIDFDLEQILSQNLKFINYDGLSTQLEHAISHALDFQLQQKLQILHIKLSTSVTNNWEDWLQENSQVWIEQLRDIMIEHRNIGHDWQFNSSQKQMLQQYYDANKLLVNCMNKYSNISCKIRQEIEDSLLLPVTRLKHKN